MLLKKREGEDGRAGEDEAILRECRFEDLGIIGIIRIEEVDGEFGWAVALMGPVVPVHEMRGGVADFTVGDVQACFCTALIDWHELSGGEYFQAKFWRKLAEEIHSEVGEGALVRHRKFRL